jgi:hypothetical protein
MGVEKLLNDETQRLYHMDYILILIKQCYEDYNNVDHILHKK